MKLNEDRRFGVEFEIILKSGVRIRDLGNALLNAGINVRNSLGDFNTGYHHSVGNRAWEIKTDCSVTGGNGGWELVSPVLQGRIGLAEVKAVCEILGQFATANRTCGMHVHHECTDLSAQAFKNLYVLYQSSQKHISYLVPKSRRNGNTYCNLLERSIDRFGSSAVQIKRNLIMMSRYHVVNFASYSLRGTIEFRQHSGTVEYDKFESWFLMTQSMVEVAKAKKTIKGRDQKSLTDFFWDLGWNLNESDAEYATARAFLKKRYREFKKS
jgi:hypothetical protein